MEPIAGRNPEQETKSAKAPMMPGRTGKKLVLWNEVALRGPSRPDAPPRCGS